MKYKKFGQTQLSIHIFIGRGKMIGVAPADFSKIRIQKGKK